MTESQAAMDLDLITKPKEMQIREHQAILKADQNAAKAIDEESKTSKKYPPKRIVTKSITKGQKVTSNVAQMKDEDS